MPPFIYPVFFVLGLRSVRVREFPKTHKRLDTGTGFLETIA